MRMSLVGKSLLYFALAFCVSCVTLNITIEFPEAQVEQAAEKIESEVRGESDAPAETSWLDHAPWRMRVRVSPRGAYAAENVNLDIETPEIRKLVQERKARWPKIEALLKKGFVGEAVDGTLKEVNPGVLPLQDAAKARQQVRSENRDREELYKEIAKANDLPMSDVAKIAREFAEVNRKKLDAGMYYQKKADDGKLVWKQT